MPKKYGITIQLWPGIARKKFNTFFVMQSFFPVICLGFGAWGTPWLGFWVGGVIPMFKNLPELVWRSVQNLVEIGPAVCT